MIFNKTIKLKQNNFPKNNKIMEIVKNQKKKNRNQNDVNIHNYS